MDEKALRKVFGERIGSHLDYLGLLQKDAADILGISPKSVSGYVTGVRMPEVPGLFELAEAFGVSLDWLFGRSEDKWAPCIKRGQRWLRNDGGSNIADAQDPQERVVRVVRCLKAHCEIINQDWFTAGVMGLSIPEYHSLMEGTGTLTQETLSRLCEFTTLPDLWFLLGDSDYLVQASDLYEYAPPAAQFHKLGISAGEVMVNMDRIQKIVEQTRRLG